MAGIRTIGVERPEYQAFTDPSGGSGRDAFTSAVAAAKCRRSSDAASSEMRVCFMIDPSPRSSRSRPSRVNGKDHDARDESEPCEQHGESQEPRLIGLNGDDRFAAFLRAWS